MLLSNVLSLVFIVKCYSKSLLLRIIKFLPSIIFAPFFFIFNFPQNPLGPPEEPRRVSHILVVRTLNLAARDL